MFEQPVPPQPLNSPLRYMPPHPLPVPQTHGQKHSSFSSHSITYRNTLKKTNELTERTENKDPAHQLFMSGKFSRDDDEGLSEVTTDRRCSVSLEWGWHNRKWRNEPSVGAALEWLLEIIRSWLEMRLIFCWHIQEIDFQHYIQLSLWPLNFVKPGQTNFIHKLFTEHKYTSICTHIFHFSVQALSKKVQKGSDEITCTTVSKLDYATWLRSSTPHICWGWKWHFLVNMSGLKSCSVIQRLSFWSQSLFSQAPLSSLLTILWTSHHSVLTWAS